MKKWLSLALVLLLAIPTVYIPTIVSAAPSIGDVKWELIDTMFETDEYIIAGYNLGEYVISGSEEDIAPYLNEMMRKLKVAGGGTVFIPAGRYKVKSNIYVQEGTVLCGDWRAPTDDDLSAVGTILEIEMNHGIENNHENAAVIMKPNSNVRDLTFWYPDQKADNIVPYPPTVQMFTKHNWGADYTFVQNCTFINSYIAIVQGPDGSGCPNVHNVYGSPVHYGLSMDEIADIGRLDYIYFSPKYWVGSGLPDAPASGAEKEAFEKYIYENATGLYSGRVDWSFWTFVEIDGYNIGEHFVEAAVSKGFSNGEMYGVTMKNCKYGFVFDGISGVGHMNANINIENCEVGIETRNTPGAEAGNLQWSFVTIDADVAIQHDGPLRMHFLKSTIKRGAINASYGTLTMSDCDFETEAPHITLEAGATGAILLGNRFNGKPVIQNIQLCPTEIDHTPIDVHMPDLMTANQSADKVVKPPRKDMIVVEADQLDGLDDTNNIQAAMELMASRGGGIVFLPGLNRKNDGGYYIGSSLIVPTNVELRGAVDIGRIPFRIGTIFNVYGGKDDEFALPTVIMEEGSIIRGIIFDWPEQEYLDVHTYPYAIQGRGSDISIVNVSIRNGYNGVDLMTYKCDNHYVLYLAGFACKNVIKIGGGSDGGFVGNLQFNSGIVNNGFETKYNCWKNSFDYYSGDVREEMRSEFLWKWVQENLVFMQIGDCTDQVVYNNFTYIGYRGVQFIEEEGKAANGWFVGNAVDATICGLEFQAIGDMDIINPQVVSLDGNIPSEPSNPITNSAVLHHVYANEAFTGTANIYNMDCWGNPATFIRAEGGTLNIYNSDYASNTKTNRFVTMGPNGTLNLLNGNLTSGSVSNLTAENADRMNVKGFYFQRTMANSTAENTPFCMIWRSTWDAPDNAVFPQDSSMLFTESFDNYPTRTSGGINNVVGTNGSFNMVSNANAGGSIIIDGGLAKFFINNTNPVQYMKNSNSVYMPAGMPHSKYYVEARLSVEAIRDAEYSLFGIWLSKMESSNNDQGAVYFINFQPDGIYALQTKIADWTADEWYRIGIDADLSDISNKTAVITLYDDEYNVIVKTDPIRLDSDMQNNGWGLGNIRLNLMADEGGNDDYSQVNMDYVFVTKQNPQEVVGVYGDLNDDNEVKAADARIALRASLKKVTLTAEKKILADVNGDGDVTAVDARLILRYSLGKVNVFPVEVQ